MEDFLVGNSETIFVSTIHKAKGREFDNVFLMLDEFKLISVDCSHPLWVIKAFRRKDQLKLKSEHVTLSEDGGIANRVCVKDIKAV